jgi:hypothetical protein
MVLGWCMFAELPDVRMSTLVTRVVPASGTCTAIVHAAGGSAEAFDAVIFATHTDTTLAILGDLAPEVWGTHLTCPNSMAVLRLHLNWSAEPALQGLWSMLSAISYNISNLYLHTNAMIPLN